MSKTTIALTLSASNPDVVLKGTVDAAGTAGSYNGRGYEAAAFGPAGPGFTLRIDGAVISKGAGDHDAGILVASPGFIRNDGGILGASRIDIFGQSAKRKMASVIDAGEIDATRGNGAYIQGAGTVRNRHSHRRRHRRLRLQQRRHCRHRRRPTAPASPSPCSRSRRWHFWCPPQGRLPPY